MRKENHNTSATVRSDAELVELTFSNDMNAFSELVGRYRTICLRNANFLLRDSGEAEDEVQNAMLKAFQHLDQWKGAGEFSGWLGRIVTNHCLNRLRAKSRYRMFYLDCNDNPDGDPIELPCQAEDPEYRLIQHQMAIVVQREIRRIPSVLRNVLLLSGLPDAVGSLHRKISELHTQPTVPAVQRFRCSLTVALTWLRGQGGSLCFP